MVVTEADLREQLRRPTVGAQVVVPAGSTLTPSARDFIKQWALVEVTAPASEATPTTTERPDGTWDRASQFPVDLTGEQPRCVCCGAQPDSKASSLTQLNAHHYAPKTHPRIKLRGKVDSLHSLTLMVQGLASRRGEAGLAAALGSLAAYCRELTSAEYNERPADPFELPGWSSDELHRATHDPSGVLGIEHLTIDGADDELQHWLNIGRSTTRELEICALETFDSPHHPYGASICHGLNRLSSVWYFLQLAWKRGGVL
ncbi:hypothetical protein [Tessaracoccus defluvii]|uniref:Cobalamin adenosyltransferase-like domain-containing protein n=1 Tax=Tessaracoccus defluvii TaxID=1285901 RepID=A0A7H0H752_9ACTN|nr:hypothetical protein [Tessaracoccus defluvii]QNP56368.1 hypothetical protein H9L22_02590 [Tessaracoccus defluvii]